MEGGLTITKTVQQYVTAHDAFCANGASNDPEWLRTLRSEAIEHFISIGFPTTRQESWRFTNVRAITEGAFTVGGQSLELGEADVAPHLVEGAITVLVANGTVAGVRGAGETLPEGLWVGGLKEALDQRADLLHEHLGRSSGAQDNGFAALNTAFVRDVAVVHVASGYRLDRPLQILYLTGGSDQPVLQHTRALVVVADGADAKLVETFVSTGADTHCTSAVTEMVVGQNGALDSYRVQSESDHAYHIATTNSRQARDSRFRLTVVPMGSKLSRHDIKATLDGPGAEGTLQGLYVLGGRQHVDHNTVLDHSAPHCTSHEYFNGILDGEAHAVFNGRIIVRPGAQKTDSKQTNNNLLLSKNARADSQPQLEIYADDVRCTHGATLGPIDEAALFYLRSRGIDEAAAQDMVTYGFGYEILERMELEPVRTAVDAALRSRLANVKGVPSAV